MENKSSSTQGQPKSARSSSIRFVLLFLVIVVAFANEYAFNNPQALQESMLVDLKIDQADFQLFYSLYALPNIFTLLFIGYLVDKFGVRISLIMLSGFIALFQLMIAIGGYSLSYYTILVGRILFGVFSESVFIPQASIISFWFTGKQQAFALGIAITFPQLGNALNSFLTPLIYQKNHLLGDPLIFSFGLCLVGLICAIIAAFIDKRADRIDEQHRISINSDTTDPQESEQIKISDLKYIKKQYWIVSLVCTFAMTLWIPFLDNANSLFQKRFCYTQVSAGKAVMVAYVVTTIISIPLGLLTDQIGKRRVLMVGGMAVFIIAQVIFLVYPQCEGGNIRTGAIAGLVFEGIGYSFYANVMVGSIPLVVKKKLLGTAFGIMEMIESFFQFIVPIITGQIVSNSSSDQLGYRITSVVFILFGIIGLVISLLLFCYISDHSRRKLDRSSHENHFIVTRRQELGIQVRSSETSNSDFDTYERQKSNQNSVLRRQTIQLPSSEGANKPLLQSYSYQL